MDEQLIAFGGEIKAFEDGRIGGYLVRFTDADSPDLVGDYFSKDTDFGIADGHPVNIYYHHGQNPTMKMQPIGAGKLSIDDVGVFIDGELALRNEYERAIHEQLIAAGKAGWSSGAVAHLVQREQIKSDVHHITHWLIGEASITPTPAAGPNLTQVINLKSLDAETDILEAATVTESVDVGEVSDEQINPISTGENLMTEQNGIDIAQTVDEAVKGAFAGYSEVKDQIVTVSETLASLDSRIKSIEEQPAQYKQAPAVLKTGLGDNETKAFAHFVRTGDEGAIKASNDTDMNVGTAADGGNAVPTGHFQGIVARRDEQALYNTLGVRNIPGIGTTVNVPLDAEDDGEFVSTAEAASTDRDAPALGQKALTLVKYTKRVELSAELLNDEDSQLMAFLNDFVGRGMAKTENDLLITEVETNGTNFKTFASATAIAAGEIEDIEGNDALGAYLDDPSVAWVMRNSTFADIRSITGSDRFYGSMATGGPGVGSTRELIGYPVYRSNKVDAIATTNKSILFGNWFYVGRRQAPGFTVLRDPYSKASNGQVVLHYYFRTVYGVLQAEAIGYGTQA